MATTDSFRGDDSFHLPLHNDHTSRRRDALIDKVESCGAAITHFAPENWSNAYHLIEVQADQMRISVRGKPGSRHPSITLAGDDIVVAVCERAIDGAANAAIVRSIAAWLDVAPNRVLVERGESSRRKVVSVDGIDATDLAAARARLP